MNRLLPFATYFGSLFSSRTIAATFGKPKEKRAIRDRYYAALAETLEPRLLMTAVKPVTNLNYTTSSPGGGTEEVTITWTNNSLPQARNLVEVKERSTDFSTNFSTVLLTTGANATLSLPVNATCQVRVVTFTALGSAVSSPLSVTTDDWSGADSGYALANNDGGGTTITWDPRSPSDWLGRSDSVPHPDRWNSMDFGSVSCADGTFNATGGGGPVWASESTVNTAFLFDSDGDVTADQASLPTPPQVGEVEVDADTANGTISFSTEEGISYEYGGLGGTPQYFEGDGSTVTVDASGYAYVLPFVPEEIYCGTFISAAETGPTTWVDMDQAATPSFVGAIPSADGKSAFICWTNSADNETGYELQRSKDNTNWTTLTTTDADTTSYIDKGGQDGTDEKTGLVPFETYYYRVRAIRSDSNLNSSYATTEMTSSPASCLTCAQGQMLNSLADNGGSAQSGSGGGATNDGTSSQSANGFADSSGGPELSVQVGATNTGDSDGSLGPTGAFADIPTFQLLYNNNVVIRQGSSALYFKYISAGVYQPTTGNPCTLSSLGDGNFAVTDSLGNKVEFSLPSSPGFGGFSKHTDPAGNVLTGSSGSNGQPSFMTYTTVDGHQDNYIFQYSYTAPYQLAEVDLCKGGGYTPTETLTFSYYGSGSDNGNAGDLKTVTHTTAGGGTEVTYFRYFTGTNLLKSMVTGESYDLMVATTTGSVDDLDDAVVAKYAANVYTYDGAGQVASIVSQGNGCSVCNGGFGNTAFDYDASGATDDVNTWSYKRIEYAPGYNYSDATDPKNVQVVTYSNYLGQTILQATIQVSTGAQSIDYYRYDDAGNVILHANPSAVTGYDESLSDLVGYNATTHNYTYLSDSSGLIDYADYVSLGSDESVQDTAISHGDGGGNVTKYYQNYFTYGSHSSGNSTYYYVSGATTFSQNVTSSPSPSSTGARNITYVPTWSTANNSTNSVATMTTTWPTIGTGQNGSGTAAITYRVNDSSGRPIWTMDAKGNIDYTQYDDATGAVTLMIQDVDTSLTSEFSNLPTGWATPAGGGLNLITTYEVDDQGRTVEEIDPNGNGIFTLYDDVDHASFSFTLDSDNVSALVDMGDSNVSGGLETTGPIFMTRTDIPYSVGSGSNVTVGTYEEDMTFSGNVAVSNGKIVMPGIYSGNSNLFNLVGTGTTSSPQFIIQSLSRTLSSNADQVLESDQYANITDSTYLGTGTLSPYSGTLNTNYYATQYGYDQEGRRKFTISPTGTVNWTMYDYLGRTASSWNGTNDSGANNSDPTGGSAGIAAGNNMIKLSENQYDADGNPIKTTVYPNDVTGDQWITLNDYNWRDELVATKSGAAANGTSAETDGVHRPISINIYDNAGEVTSKYTFDGDGTPMADTNGDGVPDTLESSLITPGGSTPASGLVAFSTASYDNQGRVYESTVFSINANGTISGSGISSDTWYDANGNVIETHSSGSAFTKTTYDGVNRLTITYTTDGGTLSANGTANVSWSAANSVSNDIVLTQTQVVYDANGNVIETITRDRDHNAGNVTGSLGSQTITIPAASSPTGANLTLTWVADIAGTNGDSYGPGYVSASGVNVDTGPSSGTATWILPPATAAMFGFSGSGWAFFVEDSSGNYFEGEYGIPVEDDGDIEFSATESDGSGASSSWSNITTFTTPGFSLIPARVSFSAAYYDAANRQTASVNVGTNEGLAWTRPSSAPTDSNTTLVTTTSYNAAGEVDYTIDPLQGLSNAPLETKYYYDSLGRVVYSVAAFDGTYDPTLGNQPTSSSLNLNQTTKYTYDGDGHTLTLTAVMPSGQANQTTQYFYGANTTQGSTIDSNDLLWKVEYPSPTTGAASSSNAASFTYNAVGQTLTKTDQNGTKHTYSYDSLGRQTLDSVTTLANGTDGSIRAIGTTYNRQGLVDTQTSYSTTTANATCIVNQIQNAYNGLGQLTKQSQEHGGAVSNATKSVQYSYGNISTGSRLISMTYPSGQVIHYNYGSNGTLNSTIGRLESLSETNGNTTVTLETYQYLGLSTVVVRAQPQADDELTYQNLGSGYSSGGTSGGDEYTGLDAFGRVVDQKWIHVQSGSASVFSPAIDEYKYTYDANGNLVAKVNSLHTAFNETYTYDALNQLANMTRGGSAYQSWDLDALGNMDSVTTGGTTVSETHADNNELTGLGNATLTYDADGNTLTDDLGHTLVYDAWNRLVTVKDASNVTLESYTYDASGHRVTETPAGSLENDLYYSSQWQVVEDDTANSGLLLHADYVWSPVFVDALILRDDHLTGSYDGTAFNFSDRLYATQDANYNVTALVAYTPQPADTDSNGQVDLADLNTVLNHLGTSNTTLGAAIGDVNNDGAVDLNDLNTVLNELGTTEGVGERFVYDSYGKVQVMTASWGSTSDAYAWQYMYQGGRYDGTTGLYDFRNREYSPTMMRWTTQDPLGYIDGLNDFKGLKSSPINFVDPLGTQSGGNPFVIPAVLNTMIKRAANIAKKIENCEKAIMKECPELTKSLGIDPMSIANDFLGVRSVALEALKKLPDAPEQALRYLGKVGDSVSLGLSVYSSYQEYQSGDTGGAVSDGSAAAITVITLISDAFPLAGLLATADGVAAQAWNAHSDSSYLQSMKDLQACQCKFLANSLKLYKVQRDNEELDIASYGATGTFPIVGSQPIEYP